MPKEWYVSFHGGEEKNSLNNIHVYSTEGTELRKALNKKSIPAGVNLRELRGFVFGPDKNLYVVNAYFEYSEILKFEGALNKDGQHDFLAVFAKRHADMNPGLDHPFNAAFDSEGDLYVSSQNTNLITRYHGPIVYDRTKLAPVAICEIFFRRAIRLISRFICYSVETAVTFLLETGETTQFYDMTFAKALRAFLLDQSLVVSMAPPE